MEIFRQTDLGAFLARHTASERQEQFQRYLMDFLLLSMKVSTWQELKVCRGGGEPAVWPGPSTGASPLRGCCCRVCVLLAEGRGLRGPRA